MGNTNWCFFFLIFLFGVGGVTRWGGTPGRTGSEHDQVHDVKFTNNKNVKQGNSVTQNSTNSSSYSSVHFTNGLGLKRMTSVKDL